MTPGLYVARIPKGRTTQRTSLILESRSFGVPEADDTNRARHLANGWREWIASQHPKDDVFVIDVPEVSND